MTESKKEQKSKPDSVAAAQGEDTCIFCGAAVPEGRMICPACEVDFHTRCCSICGGPVSMGTSLCEACAQALLPRQDK